MSAERKARMRRLEPAAITGVMSREVANFRTFWKATTFSAPAGADHLPARIRPRPRRDDRQRRRRSLLCGVRRHGNGRHRGDLLRRLPGDVRHLRQAPFPAHLRRDPRGARRRRGAGHRGDPLDLPARRRLRLLPADRLLRLWPRSDPGDAAGAVFRVHHRNRFCRVRHRGRGHGGEDRPVQLRDHGSDHPALPRGGHLLPDRPAAPGLSDRGPVQSALPAGRAGPRSRLWLRGG